MCNQFSISKLLATIVLSEILLVLVLSSIDISSNNESDMVNKTFEELYAIGKRAYLDNDWDHCTQYIEKALEKYKVYQKSMTHCKLKCNDLGKRFKPSFVEDVEDLHFYDKMVKKTLCLMKSCDYLNLDIHKDVLTSFSERAPYEYLQLCYYKVIKIIRKFCCITFCFGFLYYFNIYIIL